MSLENIRRILKKSKSKIENLFDVKELGIFGSYVRGEQKKNSDLDVLVEFTRDRKTFDNYMNLKFYLEKLFHRKVDLVMKDALKARIKEQVLADVIYA